MSPSGCLLPPSGLEPPALRPSGGNRLPLGDIMFGPRAGNFPGSRGRGAKLLQYHKVGQDEELKNMQPWSYSNFSILRPGCYMTRAAYFPVCCPTCYMTRAVNWKILCPPSTEVEKNGVYVVWSNLFLLLLTCYDWPCLGPS